jgi:hypothetical protein
MFSTIMVVCAFLGCERYTQPHATCRLQLSRAFVCHEQAVEKSCVHVPVQQTGDYHTVAGCSDARNILGFLVTEIELICSHTLGRLSYLLLFRQLDTQR